MMLQFHGFRIIRLSNKHKLEIPRSSKIFDTNMSFIFWINTSYEMKIRSCFAVQNMCHTFCTIANNDDNLLMLIEIIWVNYLMHLRIDQ